MDGATLVIGVKSCAWLCFVDVPTRDSWSGEGRGVILDYVRREDAGMRMGMNETKSSEKTTETRPS